jgi:hypothetical protein
MPCAGQICSFQGKSDPVSSRFKARNIVAGLRERALNFGVQAVH